MLMGSVPVSLSLLLLIPHLLNGVLLPSVVLLGKIHTQIPEEGEGRGGMRVGAAAFWLCERLHLHAFFPHSYKKNIIST